MPMDNVYLFVPNLIGNISYMKVRNYLCSYIHCFLSDYVRIITLIISFYYMLNTPTYAALFYLLSTFLDEFDGIAARKLKQS